MATEFKWKPAGELLTNILATELNGLQTSTSDITGFSALSAEVPNATDLYEYIALELVIGVQLARPVGAYVGVYIALALDGSTMEDASNKAWVTPLAFFPLDAGTAARRVMRANLPIPPFDFRVQALNATGQQLAASGNTLRMRRYNEQSVTF
jgi:hypothetical protein